MPWAAYIGGGFLAPRHPFLVDLAKHSSRNDTTALIPGHLHPFLKSYCVGETEDEMVGWHRRLDRT